MKYTIVCLLLVLMTAPIFPQDYEVAVTTVNVWIRATDGSGKAVTGLNQADFEVYEDGKKMDPSCFEEVNFLMPELKNDDAAADVSNPQAMEAKVNQPKRFIVYLDLFNTSQNEMERLRPDIDTFLRRIHLKDWEIMMVAYLPSGKLGVVVPFTRSISTLQKALDQAKGSTNRDQQLKKNEDEILEILAPLQLHRQDAQDQPEGGGGGSGSSRGQFGGQGNSALIEDQVFQMAMSSAYRQAAVFARQDKQAIEHAFGGLESFGEYYGKNLSNGEHTVVMFVSGGFNSEPGRRYFDLVNNYLNRTAAAIDPADFIIKSGSPVKENNFDLQHLVNDSIGKLNRYNITLYSINTRGLDSSAPDVTKADKNYASVDTNLIRDYQDSLSQMADETGGFSFQNSQNFKNGFDSVLDDISHQYLVCYRSPDHKKAEKYHSIKVVSKKPGLKLRYRQGYVD